MTVAVPYFTIDPTVHLFDIIEQPTDGLLGGEALANAQVVFQSNIPADSLLVYQGNMFRSPAKVVAHVASDGTIQLDGEPVVLLANDPGLNVTGIQYTVTVIVPTLGPLPETLGPLTFNAATAGQVVNLATVPSASALAVVPVLTSANIDDATDIGRAILTAADGAAVVGLLPLPSGGSGPVLPTEPTGKAFYDDQGNFVEPVGANINTTFTTGEDGDGNPYTTTMTIDAFNSLMTTAITNATEVTSDTAVQSLVGSGAVAQTFLMATGDGAYAVITIDQLKTLLGIT